jgi:hypothetical protein
MGRRLARLSLSSVLGSIVALAGFDTENERFNTLR